MSSLLSSNGRDDSTEVSSTIQFDFDSINLVVPLSQPGSSPDPIMSPAEDYKQVVQKEALAALISSERRESSPSPGHTSSQKRVWQALQQFSNHLYQKDWFWEFLSCIVVVVSFGVITTILACYQDRPQSDWAPQHYRVSINAVVAVLTTIVKGASMVVVAEAISQLKWLWFEKSHQLQDFDRFDRASRGPWGASRLLFWFHGPTLALLGALLTVLALAIDPFTQNIIDIRSCQTPVTNLTATIQTANVYDAYLGERRLEFMSSTTSDTLWDDTWYLLANSTLSTLKLPNYPGTFSNFSMIAKVTSECSADEPYSYYSVRRCATPDDIDAKREETYLKPMAVECILYFCSRTFDAHMRNGAVQEVEKNRTVALTPWIDTYQYYTSDRTITVPRTLIMDPELCLLSNDSLGKVSTSPPRSGMQCNNRKDMPQVDWGGGKETYYCYNNETTELWYNSRCLFQVGQKSVNAAANFFWHLWNGTVSGGSFEGTKAEPDLLDVLYGRGNSSFDVVDWTFLSIANSMTAAIRQTGGSPAVEQNYTRVYGVARGTVLIADTCIGVRWVWISLPATIGTLSILFLLLTVIQSSREGKRPVWKSTSLAVLYHGLDSALNKDSATLLHTREMEEHARRVKVRLQESGYSLLLCNISEGVAEEALDLEGHGSVHSRT
ncbi:hypothetical protein W97_02375 [Coniosporium apollinis CBS 100218]|uniref:Uncharacterized protein n=1 Tax=Coniosporium apollinis (strain CBS 100218) TaxID=1168221 RepID=R7YMR6_CONA1|nr:uncharacterized protein W97_02375 [Coniosporium apollinis CBS 100218]EON63148.1 hypothetical protein W97_02375 [Coniosporium apollinis CBS 100218]